ncbi:trans-Golgi network integral membrane protein 1-like isoform X2 [Lineus longissimus]|uniref:trans-Golgi network integral membrane protein 1-like isoform X2 n=1 Tax=Lineus longissimus TaxID=88925 RepID=UPI002B4F3488
MEGFVMSSIFLVVMITFSPLCKSLPVSTQASGGVAPTAAPSKTVLQTAIAKWKEEKCEVLPKKVELDQVKSASDVTTNYKWLQYCNISSSKTPSSQLSLCLELIKVLSTDICQDRDVATRNQMTEFLATTTRFLLLQDKTDICERFGKLTQIGKVNADVLQRLKDFAPKHKVLESLMLPFECPSYCKDEAENACKFFYILSAVSIGLPLPTAIPTTTVPVAKDSLNPGSKNEQGMAGKAGEGESKTPDSDLTTNTDVTKTDDNPPLQTNSVFLDVTKTETENLTVPITASQVGGATLNTLDSKGSTGKENPVEIGSSSSGTSETSKVAGDIGVVASVSPQNTNPTSVTGTGDKTVSEGKDDTAVPPQTNENVHIYPIEDKKLDTKVTTAPPKPTEDKKLDTKVTTAPLKSKEDKKLDTKVTTAAPKPTARLTTAKPKQDGAAEGAETKKGTTASPAKLTTKSSVVKQKEASPAAGKETVTPTKKTTAESGVRDTELPGLFPTKDYSSEYGKTNVLPESNLDSNGPKTPIKEDVKSSHFMAYFLTIVVVCIVGYVLFHNKQKIVAFILEGRGNQRRRQAQSGNVEYRKLSSNVDEVLPAADKKVTTQNYIY